MSASTSTESRPPTRRARLRQATLEEIKALAKRQLAESGPGALSLRAISREMGMASSALYRYFASQDDLISALCIDAYESVAQAMEVARDLQPVDDHGRRIWALWHAHRRWAVDHPSDFGLIFGTPVPGYQAAADVTGPAAGRFAAVLCEVYAAAVHAGAADPDRTQVPASLQAGELFPVLMKYAIPGFPPRQAGIVLNAWTSVRGFVTGEIFGSLRLLFADYQELFNAHVRTVLLGMGYRPELVAAVAAGEHGA